jgi:hypothetical protein
MPRVANATPETSPAPAPTAAVIPFPRNLTREDVRRKVRQGRLYVWSPYDTTPTQYLSVTSALKSIPKDWLGAWAAKLVAETAVEKRDLLATIADDDPAEAVKWLKGAPWSARDRAADAGTTLHEIAELDALGETAEADIRVASLDHEAQRKARQLRDFFARVPHRLIAVEQIVFSDLHRYAGTIDFVVEFTDPTVTMNLPFPAGTVVLDLKTGKGVYPETALQLAAYRGAQTVADLDNISRSEMYPSMGAAVLHVTESSWALHPVDAGAETFELFLSALSMAKVLPLPDALVGPAVMRGRG